MKLYEPLTVISRSMQLLSSDPVWSAVGQMRSDVDRCGSDVSPMRSDAVISHILGTGPFNFNDAFEH